MLCYTPLPPAPTGIADYSFALLKELAAPTDGQAAWNLAACSPNAPAAPFPIFSPEHAPADGLALYQIGNSAYHDFQFPIPSHSVERPVAVVLHDLVLHHARLQFYLNSEEVKAYRDDMGSHPKRERALAQLNDYRDEVRAHYPDRGDTIAEIALRMGGGRFLYRYPLFEHVANSAGRVLVHSEAARDEVLNQCPDAHVERVRMGVEVPEAISRGDARERLGMDPRAVVLASFGLVTPEKQIPMALSALGRLHRSGQKAHYFLVGSTVSHYDVQADIEAHGLGDWVHVTGRLDDEDFWLHAYAADLCLNLRYPSAGETSATLLGLLGRGCAVAITEQILGPDLPADVVIRVSLDGNEDGLFCDLMDWLCASEERRELGQRARQFMVETHTVAHMASGYRRVLGDLV